MVSVSGEKETNEELINMRKDLEMRELEAPGCRPSPDVYAKLLAIYLQENDLCSAKFLWKRIPDNVKSEHGELTKVWAVAQALWRKDHPGTFQALKSSEWSDNVRALMNHVTEITRGRNLNLVSSAYSSICLADFSQYVGLPEKEAKLLATSQEGWGFDEDRNMVLPAPKKLTTPNDSPTEEQLIQLTDFISFLEKH